MNTFGIIAVLYSVMTLTLARSAMSSSRRRAIEEGVDVMESLLRKVREMSYLMSIERRASTELSSAEQQQMLDTHNRLRGQEGASNMQTLTWSNELAEKAQDLANSCVFEHAILEWPGSTYPNVGQNIYISSGEKNLDEAMNEWYNEKEFYTYGSGCQPGQVCGHYTQLVWAQTKELGCGVHFCASAQAPMFGTTFDNSNFIVCNYGPAGNMMGEEPYQR